MIFECRHCFATIDTEELDYLTICPSCNGFLNETPALGVIITFFTSGFSIVTKVVR